MGICVMYKISKVYLKKIHISKLGYVNGNYYLGYIHGTYIYEARWEITARIVGSESATRDYGYLEYFRATNRNEAKKQFYKFVAYYGCKPEDIKFYK